jgi:precorrin-6A/cobalt-precorrin-6A reductase
MILLLGGTTEAAPIAETLTKAGFEILLSMATSIPPPGGLSPGMRLRIGELDAQGISDLIHEQGIRAVVDATHPYASAISAIAWTVCRRTGTPYVAFDRPSAVADGPDIHWADDHAHASVIACSFGLPVLLTIGVRNLAPYVTEVRLNGVKLVARVLDRPFSIEACNRAGLDLKEIVCANGPFSVTENALLIAQHHIGVLVTKDSGDAGGVRDKIDAARDSGRRIVVVKRPPRPEAGHSSIPALMKALRSGLGSDSGGRR